MDKLDKFIPKDTNKWIKKVAEYYMDGTSDDPRDFKNMQENYKLFTTNNCKKEGEWRFETKNWFEYTDFDWFGHRGLGRIFVP